MLQTYMIGLSILTMMHAAAHGAVNDIVALTALQKECALIVDAAKSKKAAIKKRIDPASFATVKDQIHPLSEIGFQSVKNSMSTKKNFIEHFLAKVFVYLPGDPEGSPSSNIYREGVIDGSGDWIEKSFAGFQSPSSSIAALKIWLDKAWPKAQEWAKPYLDEDVVSAFVQMLEKLNKPYKDLQPDFLRSIQSVLKNKKAFVDHFLSQINAIYPISKNNVKLSEMGIVSSSGTFLAHELGQFRDASLAWLKVIQGHLDDLWVKAKEAAKKYFSVVSTWNAMMTDIASATQGDVEQLKKAPLDRKENLFKYYLEDMRVVDPLDSNLNQTLADFVTISADGACTIDASVFRSKLKGNLEQVCKALDDLWPKAQAWRESNVKDEDKKYFEIDEKSKYSAALKQIEIERERTSRGSLDASFLKGWAKNKKTLSDYYFRYIEVLDPLADPGSVKKVLSDENLVNESGNWDVEKFKQFNKVTQPHLQNLKEKLDALWLLVFNWTKKYFRIEDGSDYDKTIKEMENLSKNVSGAKPGIKNTFEDKKKFFKHFTNITVNDPMKDFPGDTSNLNVEILTSDGNWIEGNFENFRKGMQEPLVRIKTVLDALWDTVQEKIKKGVDEHDLGTVKGSIDRRMKNEDLFKKLPHSVKSKKDFFNTFLNEISVKDPLRRTGATPESVASLGIIIKDSGEINADLLKSFTAEAQGQLLDLFEKLDDLWRKFEAWKQKQK